MKKLRKSLCEITFDSHIVVIKNHGNTDLKLIFLRSSSRAQFVALKIPKIKKRNILRSFE